MALSKTGKEHVIANYGASATDTGSTTVQIALLTERINQLSEHLEKFPKDFSSKRGLLRAVSNRRKLLDYYKRTHKDSYKSLIDKLGLRK